MTDIRKALDELWGLIPNIEDVSPETIETARQNHINLTLPGERSAEERLTILTNRNAGMTPGKLAAQTVHAALAHYGIDHGAVIVLDATPTKIMETCEVVIRDAGRTELEPGTLTAGVRRAYAP